MEHLSKLQFDHLNSEKLKSTFVYKCIKDIVDIDYL